MIDRNKAVRELYAALDEAIRESAAVAAAKKNLEACGMVLAYVETEVYFSLASCLRSPREPGESDAEFLRKLRIEPDIAPR